MASLNSLEEMLITVPSSMVGIGGYSLWSPPFIFDVILPHLNKDSWFSSLLLKSIVSCGKVPTNSVKSLAGNVGVPSSYISAPIHVLIAISRLVAESFNRF